MNSTSEKIKAMILELPVEEITQLTEEIADAIETKEFMTLAETGFQEWEDSEEAIYNS